MSTFVDASQSEEEPRQLPSDDTAARSGSGSGVESRRALRMGFGKRSELALLSLSLPQSRGMISLLGLISLPVSSQG
jgi:hypothetical protein